jgi:hypothetical protein
MATAKTVNKIPKAMKTIQIMIAAPGIFGRVSSGRLELEGAEGYFSFGPPADGAVMRFHSGRTHTHLRRFQG